jgi:hypothetical protein
MPVQCGTTVLTGQDGSIWFKPAGTSVCLLAADFPAGTGGIFLPITHDFRVGDPVSFRAEGAANLDDNLTTGATYYIISISGNNQAAISTTKGGAAVALAGDTVTSGGTHVNMEYAAFESVCNVSMFDLNLTRPRIDITSLPCNFTTQAASKYAPFRTYQPGFADGTGTMTVKFSRDQSSISARLLANSLLRVQDGASARLFIDTVVNNSNQVSLADSSYIEVALSIEGMQFSVTTEDSPTEATINFSFQSSPTHMFYTSLV